MTAAGVDRYVDQDTETEAPPAVVRLSVNLAPDVAGVLKTWARDKTISVTEAVRRAIVVWNFLETENERGNRLALIETDKDGNERIREIVLV